MSVPAWLVTYRGADELTLTAASSAGLVRRAVGLLTKAPPTWVSRGETDGVVLAHRQEVRLDAVGPASARCACPAVGVCVHVVLACLFAHAEAEALAASGPGASAAQTEESSADERSQDDGTAQTGESGPAAGSAVADLTALTPARALGHAGVVAARAVAARLAALPAESAGASVEVEAHRLLITWDRSSVVLVAGAGWGGVLVPSGVAHRRVAETRLEAVVRARTALGLGWEWPEGVVPAPARTELTDAERAYLASARDALTGALASGVARLDASAATRIEAAVTQARVHHLPELAVALARVSQAVRHVVTGSDAVDDAELVGAIATAWAMTRALERADGEVLAGLRGSARDLTRTGEMEVQPLGVWTWSATSGARGASVAFLTPEHGLQIQESVAGRARAQDPSFIPSAATIWGVPVRRLLERTWTLREARATRSGEISAGGQTQASAVGPHDGALLARTGVTRWADLAPPRVPRLIEGRTELALLVPAEAGKLRLDEVAQELVWPLIDAEGAQLEARIGVLEAEGSPADHLIRLAESVGSAGLVLNGVLVRRQPAATILLGAVVTRRTGAIELRSFTLGWPIGQTAHATAGSRRLRGALDALRSRVERRPHEANGSADTLLRRLCDEIREASIDVAVSGRALLGEGDRQRLLELSRRCGDVGLTLLAGALERWAEQRTGAAEPEDLLRVLLLAERAAVVA